MSHAEQVVIRFADGDTSTLTVSQVCAHLGVDESEYREAMDGLVATGWLQPMDDGSFTAAIPPRVS